MASPPACFSANVVIAPYTTIGLGGPARWFARCTSLEDLRETLTFARNEGLPVQVFSGGSNIIFADEGFDGVALNVALRGLTTVEAPGGTDVTAAAGEPWDGVVAHAAENGLSGIECLSGIPGSAGGTPVQNVGAYGQEVAETITAVRTLDRRTLEERTFPGAACAFGYRTSRFKTADAGRYIITGVSFRLKRNTGPLIRYAELAREIDARREGRTTPGSVRETVLFLRRKKSMVIDPADGNSRSVGSFFTNPVVPEDFLEKNMKGMPVPAYPSAGGTKLSAAWLVEHAGFPRGFRMNGAALSDNHALAIVNRGGTSADVLALAGRIEEAVFEKFGVRLEKEPVVVHRRPA